MAMSDPLDFSGKVVLVTGSSRGIGAEMIKAFGARGAQCVVNYVADPDGTNKADATNVAAALPEPLVIECDVTNPAQVEAMMKQIQERHGGLNVLVNNSGIIIASTWAGFVTSHSTTSGSCNAAATLVASVLFVPSGSAT